jgi:hypothetical protein
MHYDVDLGDFMHIHFEGKKRILLFDQEQSPFYIKFRYRFIPFMMWIMKILIMKNFRP